MSIISRRKLQIRLTDFNDLDELSKKSNKSNVFTCIYYIIFLCDSLIFQSIKFIHFKCKHKDPTHISTYINTKMYVCLSVCSSRPFQNRLGFPFAQSCFLLMGVFLNNNIFFKYDFLKSYCPFSIFHYISL